MFKDVRHVLKEITEYTLETGHILEFFGIDAREYKVIEEALGETGRAFKPRLSYDYEKQSLLVNMPSAIHEAPFDCLKLTLGQTITSLPYDHDTIYPMIHMNSSLKVKRKTVTPDICLTITPSEGPTKIKLIPFFGECMCSEDKKHAINKLAKTIRAHPDIKMAVLGLVREAQPYHRPKRDSHAWNFFSTDPEPLPLEEFITEHFPSCSSITITGHNWCHVSSVEFLVWVQGDDEAAIDLNKEDAEHMAYGTLLPDLNMDAVKLDPSIDCTELEKAPITFLPIWKDYLIACRNGADVTAWTRVHGLVDSFFFWNSGSEAIEASLKMARQITGQQNIIGMQGGYHGRTFGAMALTKNKTIYHEGSFPLMPGVFAIPFPYWHQLGLPINTSEEELVRLSLYQLDLVLKQQTAPRDTAAIIIKLVLREVQSVFGRTCKYFNVEYSGVQPDILTIAKNKPFDKEGWPILTTTSLDKLPMALLDDSDASNLNTRKRSHIVMVSEMKHLSETFGLKAQHKKA
ncbi:hypothetical protein DFJ58DRAFT_729275 [Suillus subalutaceus]|uniref:uncharacterized protein n=1 Tax=Suillus subalutaceus TaxID=48586 RepID=UPI001B87A494|nr:uncharacterized protein DFJ58DRAFT_729275 [Suillus subalutaceus]KAG1850397.1 hypothetical protein DFJ58DRAFT_729275 [Suillus subalutaceus]